MTKGSLRIQRWKENIFRVAAAGSRRITEPSASLEHKQRRRIRLLAAFLILMTINTLVSSIVLKSVGGDSWMVLLATSVALLFGYLISRTRYYRAALIIAITIPAIPPLAIAVFKLPEVNLAAELMWLAMPLMVSALMLTVRQTIGLAFSYLTFIIVLKLSGLMGFEVMAPVMGYLSIITFFVIAIAFILRRDQSDIENRLNERQQFEKTLRESEEKYRNLFEYAKDAIIVVDAQTGILVDVNPAACRLVGLPKERIVGMHQSRLHPPELVESYKQVFREHVEKGIVVTDDILIQRADGSQVMCDLSANVVTLADKQFIQGVFRDVSERKQMEKALQIEKNKLQSVIDAMTDDLTIQDRDFNIIFQNEPTRMSSGGDHVGQKCYRVYENREDLCEGCPVELAFKDGKPHTSERRRVLPSGEITFWEVMANPVRDASGGVVTCLEIGKNITERKKQEQALANEMTRRRILIEQSSDGIVILDQNGAVYEANRRFAEMLGYSPEEILKLNVWDWEFLYPPEQVREMIKTIDEAGDHFKTQHRRKDGTIYDVEISTNGVMFAGQKLVFCVCRDISERNRIEKALRESEEKFSIAFRSSPVIIAITTLKDGKFVEVNDSYIHSTGYTSKELVGRTATDINIWAKPEDHTRLFKILKEQGKVSNEEFDFRMKSGEIRTWLFSAEQIDIAGKPCLIGVSTDITDKKQAGAALRESEEKFSVAFRSSPQMIAITNLETGKYTEVNDSFAHTTGYTHEELIGHNVNEFNLWIKQEDQEKMERLLNERGKMENEEYSFRMRSGEVRQWLCSAEIISIGGVPSMLAVATDITERKKMEEGLKQAMADLEQSNAQLAGTNKELVTFSYSVSHDLRSPLRSIDGFSQALLEDYKEKLDEKGQDYLRRLRSASQKMGELIDGILKLSRLTRSEMRHEPIDLSALAEEITARLQETQPERRVKFIIDKELIANGDPQLVRALLENLLGNAWKFTGKKPRAKIEFSIDRNNGKKAYFIRDNGAGFDMTYADKLFGAFQRLHESTDFPGAGIGLATAQRIIHRHGGDIWAEGVVGKGATFHFTLE